MRKGAASLKRAIQVPSTDNYEAETVLKALLAFAGGDQANNVSAKELIERFGSLSAILAAEPYMLRESGGLDNLTIQMLKTVQAAAMLVVREPLKSRPVIGSTKKVLEYFSVAMRHATVESLRILFLNSKNMLITDEEVACGTVDQVKVYPREVVRRSLQHNAASLILVHNHPSGDPAPSDEDVALTRSVIKALKLVDVVVHDHIIIGRNSEVSMRKAGLL